MKDKKVKLISVGEPTTQGISFKFEGLPHFHDKWYSWEAIASKMLGIPVEAEPEKSAAKDASK